MKRPDTQTLSATHYDLVDLYDRIAPRYDTLHRRWLKHAGGEAQAALEAAARALITPHTKLLDAGCGTGAFARKLIAEGMSPERITLLDPSQVMLSLCDDMAAPRIKGRLEAIPFDDGEFDIVTCAWALETVPSPATALRELCRVVRPGGALCLAFCANTPASSMTGWLMRQALTRRNTGRFLDGEVVVSTIEGLGGFETRLLPCNGPVSALIGRRWQECASADTTRPQMIL